MTKEEFMKSPRDFKFQIDPIDMGIAQMQFALTKRIKAEKPQVGVPFHPIIERVALMRYVEFGEQTVRLSETGAGVYELTLSVVSKQGNWRMEQVMYRGGWEEVCAYIDSSSATYGEQWGFFSLCKGYALWMLHSLPSE